jgi:hypothetical protein
MLERARSPLPEKPDRCWRQTGLISYILARISSFHNTYKSRTILTIQNSGVGVRAGILVSATLDEASPTLDHEGVSA